MVITRRAGLTVLILFIGPVEAERSSGKRGNIRSPQNMISTHEFSSNLWKHEFCMDLDQITVQLNYSSSKSLTSLFASNSEAG